MGIAPSVAFSDGLLSLTFRNFQLLKLVCNKLRKCHSKNVLRDLSWLALYYPQSALRPARAAGRSGVALHPAGRSERRCVSHREPWEELEVGGGQGRCHPDVTEALQRTRPSPPSAPLAESGSRAASTGRRHPGRGADTAGLPGRLDPGHGRGEPVAAAGAVPRGGRGKRPPGWGRWVPRGCARAAGDAC